MILVIVVVVIAIVLLVAAAIVGRRLWRRRAEAPPTTEVNAVDEAAERRARQRALEPVETELLDRRIQLDSRRGTLGGDAEVFDALERLEERFQAGEISEDELEAEKIRLLSGG